MSTIIHLLRGQMSSPVNHLGGRCPHMLFFTGGQMSEGANVRLPPKRQSFTRGCDWENKSLALTREVNIGTQSYDTSAV